MNETYAKNPPELFLWEPSGVNRPMWPVTVGIPFPEGWLTSVDRLRVTDCGREVDMATGVLSRWKDGSVRWAILDFQTDLAGNQKKVLALALRGEAESTQATSNTLDINETAKGINIINGNLRIDFAVGGAMPFDNLMYKGKPLLDENKPVCTAGENGQTFHARCQSVTVECANAFRAVVRCDGKFVAEDGGTLLDLTTRVYLFAGKAFVKIYHTITNREGRDVFLDGLEVRIPHVMGKSEKGYITGCGVDDSIYEADAGEASLGVGVVPVRETQYDAAALSGHVECADRLGEIDGTTEYRADGECIVQFRDGSTRKAAGQKDMFPYAVSGLVFGSGAGVALACRNFYPQAPKKMTVKRSGILLNLYDSSSGKPLQFWRGTAKTHEMHLIVRDGDDVGDVMAYKRLVLSLEEPVAPTYGGGSWLQRTEVFGPMLHYQPEKYPWMEFVFRHIFEQWVTNPGSAMRGSTFLDYGDTWNPQRGGQWQNNEMDFGAGLLLYMFRTGNPAPFGAAEAIVHHMMDVDTHHEAPNPLWTGAQRYHQVRHGAFSGPLMCHQWLEGPLLYYLLTGYERAREVALMRADHYCASIEAGLHRVKNLERVQGWPLVALSIMNDYFPNERYVRACDSILGWLEEWMDADGDMVFDYMWRVVEGEKGATTLGRGVICQALAHYHRLTGDVRAWNLLLRLMTLAREKLLTPEGLGTKTSLLRRNYYAPGESDFILEALGYLWETTCDPEWMRLGILNFKLSLILRDPIKGTHNGVAGNASEIYRHWPPFLYYADRSGMLEDLRIY